MEKSLNNLEVIVVSPEERDSRRSNGNLQLVYDRGRRLGLSNKKNSVAPLDLSPNGVIEFEKEEVTEQWKQYLQQFGRGLITRNNLYKSLRRLWGKQVFEDTRTCHENMKQRASGGYATIDNRFLQFPDFLSHMGPRPYKEASIHRKNNSMGYSPENCEWADKKTQSRERTNTIYLNCGGESLPLTEWAERLQIPAHVLRSRRSKGWSDAEIVEGRKRDSIRVPEYAPWPPAKSEMLEKHFRSIGGKTHEQRLAYFLKKVNTSIEQLLNNFKEDWSFPHELSEEELDEFKQWDSWLELALSHQKNMIRELKLRGLHDVIYLCNDKYIKLDELFTEAKRRWIRFW